MTLRGVLIGCGFFANNHMRAWSELDGAEIVAVCDRDAEKAQAFGSTYGVRWFTDATVMLDEVKPDFTDIVTTAPSHGLLVKIAAQRSGGVICQKPLALSMEEAQSMVAACHAAGVPLLVHENFRWQAPIRETIARVKAGDVGTPFFLRLNFRHAYDIYSKQPYLAKTEDLALTDVGPHLFDMARALMGDVSRVYCQTRNLNDRVSSPDSFLAHLSHAEGGSTSVECSFFSHYQPDRFPQTLLTIEGDEGAIEVLEGFRLRFHGKEGMTETSAAPLYLTWGEQPFHVVQESVLAFQRHAIDVLSGLVEGQPTGSDNLKTLALTMAAIRSAASGNPISLP